MEATLACLEAPAQAGPPERDGRGAAADAQPPPAQQTPAPTRPHSAQVCRLSFNMLNPFCLASNLYVGPAQNQIFNARPRRRRRGRTAHRSGAQAVRAV